MMEYERLQNQLEYARWKHKNHDSEEEEVILDQMDCVWNMMTREERKAIHAKTSKPEPSPPSEFVDVDVSQHPGPVRKRR